MGFSVHPEKCNLVPLCSQEFLGTQVNSKKMQVRMAQQKLHSIRRKVQAVFKLHELGLLSWCDNSQVCSVSSMHFHKSSF